MAATRFGGPSSGGPVVRWALDPVGCCQVEGTRDPVGRACGTSYWESGSCIVEAMAEGDDGTDSKGAPPEDLKKVARMVEGDDGTDSKGPPPEDLETKVGRIEVTLFEQEHRLFTVLSNLAEHGFNKRSKFRAATWKALIYTMLVGRGAAVGVGIVAVTGLVIAYQANQLLREQNKAVVEQVKLSRDQGGVLQKQILRAEALDRTKLLVRLLDFADSEENRADDCGDRLDRLYSDLSTAVREQRRLPATSVGGLCEDLGGIPRPDLDGPSVAVAVRSTGGTPRDELDELLRSEIVTLEYGKVHEHLVAIRTLRRGLGEKLSNKPNSLGHEELEALSLPELVSVAASLRVNARECSAAALEAIQKEQKQLGTVPSRSLGL